MNPPKDMELIDFFAAQALLGLVARVPSYISATPAQIASEAYQLAQAMLDERIEVPDEQ